MKDKMIFKNNLYKFEISEEIKEKMNELGMTMEDIKNAFLKEEEQKEHFSNLTIEDNGSFVYSDLNGNSIVIEKEKNILKIVLIY